MYPQAKYSAFLHKINWRIFVIFNSKTLFCFFSFFLLNLSKFKYLQIKLDVFSFFKINITFNLNHQMMQERKSITGYSSSLYIYIYINKSYGKIYDAWCNYLYIWRINLRNFNIILTFSFEIHLHNSLSSWHYLFSFWYLQLFCNLRRIFHFFKFLNKILQNATLGCNWYPPELKSNKRPKLF